ncbi:hypothetical protein RIF29_09015 [Crotalaria pallida]|uniref:Uncharacterized protein n=1 Tax=Crotalaria pallida TaxID=3830 RepID=A0AAN9IJ96_CROPI
MGLSLSLLISAWKELVTHSLFALSFNISFSAENSSAILRAGSFNKRESKTTTASSRLKDHRPQQAILERNLSPCVEDNKEKEMVSESVSSKSELLQHKPVPILSLPEEVVFSSPRPISELDAAATKLQKMYKNYRMRRKLADCAVVAEELWWKGLDIAALKKSSVLYLDAQKQETVVSRWARARTRAAKKEREEYEVNVENGKLVYVKDKRLVDTDGKSKWIFVLSTTRTLYVGRKQKGAFQHSSFLAGAATLAAGRLVSQQGVLKAIWPYSGHYHPTEENFKEFISFLEEHKIDLSNVKRCAVDDDDPTISGTNSLTNDSQKITDHTQTSQSGLETSIKVNDNDKDINNAPIDKVVEVKKIESSAFDFIKRLSCKWSTVAGAHIGCVRDYPEHLQLRALDQVNLSPKPPFARNNGKSLLQGQVQKLGFYLALLIWGYLVQKPQLLLQQVKACCMQSIEGFRESIEITAKATWNQATMRKVDEHSR